MPHLRTLTGPSPQSLTPTAPNSSTLTQITPNLSSSLFLKHFTGAPSAPSTSPIFTHPLHQSNLFSLQLTFTPPHNIQGDNLLLANTFDRPIRDKLPYFFNAAWKGLRMVDPGVDGDPWADKPFIYGPCLSSINRIQIVGPGGDKSSSSDEPNPVEEDMTLCHVDGLDIPTDASGRMKYFLKKERREKFVWEEGKTYRMEFCNGFIDFDDFTVVIPGLGWKVGVLKYWDGQPFRYELVERVKGVEGEERREGLGCVQFEVVVEEGEKVEDSGKEQEGPPEEKGEKELKKKEEVEKESEID